MVNRWSSWGLGKGMKMKARLELKFYTGMKNVLVIQKLVKKFLPYWQEAFEWLTDAEAVFDKNAITIPPKISQSTRNSVGGGSRDLPKSIEIYY